MSHRYESFGDFFKSRNAMSLPHHFSPQDLKDLPVVNSSHMFQEEERDMSHTSENESTKNDSNDSPTSGNDDSDEPVKLKTMIRQENNIPKLRKVTTFKSVSDSEE